jgi:hypothetical protein
MTSHMSLRKLTTQLLETLAYRQPNTILHCHNPGHDSFRSHLRTEERRMLHFDSHQACEGVDMVVIRLEHIESKAQQADILTKSLHFRDQHTRPVYGYEACQGLRGMEER